MKPIYRTKSATLLGLHVTVHLGLSDDGWYWIANNQDKHTDLAAVVILQREGFPKVLRLTLGPVNLMLNVGRKF